VFGNSVKKNYNAAQRDTAEELWLFSNQRENDKDGRATWEIGMIIFGLIWFL
jgi:hypothetical protein